MLVLLLVGQLLFTRPSFEPVQRPQTGFFASFSSQGTGMIGSYFRLPQITPGLDLGLGLLNLRTGSRTFTYSTFELSYQKTFGASSFRLQLFYTFPLKASTRFEAPFSR